MYREKLANLCLTRSNGDNFCLYCCDQTDADPKKGKIQWVLCDNCSYIIHLSCVIFYHKLPDNTSSKELYLICLVCGK